MDRERQSVGSISTAEELEFAVFCIENVAARLGLEPEKVYRALSGETGLLQGYIVPGYDALHTQGKEYIVNELLELMKERGVAL